MLKNQELTRREQDHWLFRGLKAKSAHMMDLRTMLIRLTSLLKVARKVRLCMTRLWLCRGIKDMRSSIRFSQMLREVRQLLVMKTLKQEVVSLYKI